MTEAEAHDLSRTLRYVAEQLRREAAALDSTASWIETRPPQVATR